ncbi:MAG: hypothetical protein R2853_04830 [Thermomicrobiales bacterium]
MDGALGEAVRTKSFDVVQAAWRVRAVEKGQHLAPGVGAGFAVFGERAVEEGVWRTGIDDQAVGHAGIDKPWPNA